MSDGFSADWLDLREAADHRARNAALARDLAQSLGGGEAVAVADLGCGTGSNLRATAPLLGPAQRWTLVDADQALLDAAVPRLERWADAASREGEALILVKDGRRIAVAFRCADLTRDLDRVLGEGVDLVAASALFDLVSPQFIGGLVEAVARSAAALLAVLTYDGRMRFEPAATDDDAVRDAFHAHQRRDKGFGPAAGPDAARLLAASLRAAGYAVSEGDSAWRLAAGDAALTGELVAGCAAATAEIGLLDAARLARWRAHRRTGSLVGHTDVLGLPPQRAAAAGTARSAARQ
jgi:SAM-dependent methyltransferase